MAEMRERVKEGSALKGVMDERMEWVKRGSV